MPNLANIDNPTEEQEQMAFVQWLRLKGYAHFRVPNETYTKSFKQKAKNKALGVSSGVPDLAVVVPINRNGWPYDAIRPLETSHQFMVVNRIARDDHGKLSNVVFGHRLVFIEMKRKKGGTISANQKRWLKTLNEAGVQSVVCKGCDEAIKFIESITK